jgi:hypothetical protein
MSVLTRRYFDPRSKVMKNAAVIALSVAPVVILGVKAYIALCLDNLSNELNDRIDQSASPHNPPKLTIQNPASDDDAFTDRHWYPSLKILKTEGERSEDF